MSTMDKGDRSQFVTLDSTHWHNSRYVPHSNGRLLKKENVDGVITGCWVIDSRDSRWSTIETQLNVKKGDHFCFAYWMTFDRDDNRFMKVEFFQENYEMRTTYRVHEFAENVIFKYKEFFLVACTYEALEDGPMYITVVFNNMNATIYPAQEEDVNRTLTREQRISILTGRTTNADIGNLADIRADSDKGVYYLPECMVIGWATRSGGFLGKTYPEVWQRITENKMLEKLQQLPQLIPGCLVGWYGNYTADDDTYSYLAGILAPKGTPVPKGCQFRYLPECLVAKGLPGGDFDFLQELIPFGYVTNYELRAWNAELHFSGKWEHQTRTIMTPVRKNTIEYE